VVSGLSDDARIVAAPDTSMREGQPIEAAR
jgi:hypothetical protein